MKWLCNMAGEMAKMGTQFFFDTKTVAKIKADYHKKTRAKGDVRFG